MNAWIVLLSAVVYWGGVSLRALHIKRRLGRSPNLRPRGPKEKWLWAGWATVVLGWVFTPALTRDFGERVFFRPFPFLEAPFFVCLGLAAIAAGFAGTVWCHAALGDAWRVGVGGEKTPLVTNGPYQRLRHPLYFFQIVILSGVFWLFPSPFVLSLEALHLALVCVKIADEERHLERLHGSLYKEYRQHTGTLWPKV